MKVFVAALVLLVAIASTSSAVPRLHHSRARGHHGVAARSGAPASVQCPPNNDNWIGLPNPESCESFYICDWGNPILMACPAGTHFNPTLMVCDWPNAAGCTVGQQPSTSKPVEETEKPQTTAAPVVTDAPVEETTQPEVPEETTQPEGSGEETTQPEGSGEETTQPGGEEETTEPSEGSEEITEAPEEENPGPDCPAEGTFILPNPADCETFWLCSFGSSFLVTCPDNQAFDVRYSTCTEAAEDQCRPDEETTESGEDGVTTTEAPEEEGEGTTQAPEEEVTTDAPEDEDTTTDAPEEEDTTTDAPEEEDPTTDAPEDGNAKVGCEKVSCDNPANILQANPDDCGSFCMCSSLGSQQFLCPSGLHFDASLLACNWPEEAGCQAA